MKSLASILLIVLIVFISSCDKKEITAKPNPMPYLKYSWESVIDSMQGGIFYGITLANNGDLYVNYEYTVSNEFRRGTLLSTSFGSWNKAFDFFPDGGLWSTLCRHKNRLIGSNQGLYYSDDEGNSWIEEQSIEWGGPKNIVSNDLSIVITDYELVNTFISHNDGNTWIEPSIHYFLYPQFIENKIFGLAEVGMVSSSDQGETWEIDSTFIEQGLGFYSLLGYAITSEGTVIAKYDDIYFKKNNSELWVSISGSLSSGEFNFIYNPGDNILIVQSLSNHKIYFSNDFGENWMEFMQGITDQSVCTGMVKKDNYLYMSADKGL